MNVSIAIVKKYFLELQERIIDSFEELEPEKSFLRESFTTPNGGLACPRVLADGRVIEKAAVQFSYSVGDRLPEAASSRNPHLAQRPFQATAISVIVHPKNPKVPTAHMNLRMFLVDDNEKTWFFGGGFDLTPYFLFEEDVRFWHEQARNICDTDEQYLELKQNCDRYFYLPHRGETRGVGGIFFDDWCKGGFQSCFDFVKSVGACFLQTYITIVQRRATMSWTPNDENWMLLRRGRYAEFNLAIDRGTKYGLQSGRRIESVLASLPPRVIWSYQPNPKLTDEQAKLTSHLQPGINWLRIVDNSVDKL